MTCNVPGCVLCQHQPKPSELELLVELAATRRQLSVISQRLKQPPKHQHRSIRESK